MPYSAVFYPRRGLFEKKERQVSNFEHELKRYCLYCSIVQTHTKLYDSELVRYFGNNFQGVKYIFCFQLVF